MPFQKHVQLPGSERQTPAGASQSGSLDPKEVMQVTVILRPAQSSAEHVPVQELLARGESLSRDEYEARYGADPADIQMVQAFASTYGLAVAQINMAARSVVLTGTCANFVQAFQANLARYEQQGIAFRARTGAVSIPQELANVIVGVHGLDNRPQAKPHFRLANQQGVTAAAAAVSYTALQVAKAYSFPTGVTGSGVTVGIIELGGGFTQSDLNTYFSNLKISPAPTVIAISVDGAQNAPTGDTSGPDTEVMLDIEVVERSRPALASLSISLQTPMPDSWTPSTRPPPTR